MKNLVITGLGAVTPVGIGVDEYWQGIVDMKCGIEKITKFSDENVPITIADRDSIRHTRTELHSEHRMLLRRRCDMHSSDAPQFGRS